MWVFVHFLHYTCVFDCVHAQLFLFASSFKWMKCTLTYTISSCHAITSPSVTANKLREGTGGERLLCLTLHSSERVLRGIALERTLVCAVQHRWAAMDTRPPLVKPRCPCFIRHPTGSAALLISGFRQLAPRPSSTSHWPLLLMESSSLQIFSFSNRWMHGRAE